MIHHNDLSFFIKTGLQSSKRRSNWTYQPYKLQTYNSYKIPKSWTFSTSAQTNLIINRKKEKWKKPKQRKYPPYLHSD
jgi:hypothetical protein